MSKYYKNAEGMVSGKLTAVKATHILDTVTIFKRVNGVLSVSWENVNTTYNLIGTAGGFSGDLLGLRMYPFLLTDIQKNDEEIRLFKQINMM